MRNARSQSFEQKVAVLALKSMDLKGYLQQGHIFVTDMTFPLMPLTFRIP